MTASDQKIQILLTNDDGINSPGLWAAAEALSGMGYVTVAAPREQSSGAGRSLPPTSDGIIKAQTLRVRDKEWPVYSVGGTPAQSVLYAILEIMPRRPDLVVSGINYGENVGSGVTISGTVGAALEGASLGVPALAISLEVDLGRQLTYSPQVDFSTARYFTTFFSRILLEEKLPEDVAVLKVDVPADATPETPWAITRQAMHRYYLPTAPERESWQEPGKMGFRLDETVRQAPPGTDVHALTVQRVVSVTPLSLDLTARVDLADLEKQLLSHRSAQMKK